MTPSSGSLMPIPQHDITGVLSTVNGSTKWGIFISFFNLVYGYLLVASQLRPDPRQDSWLLMRSPLPTYVLSVAYVVGVTWLGPRLMAYRKPMESLRPFMVVYNAFQVVFSFWLMYESGMGGWLTSYDIRCQPCDFSDSPEALRMLHATYWYYFSKFVDFLDTVFFVLGKKYEHISLLHVVHHSLMPVSMWFGVRYQPGGHSTLMGFLNSFVHTVMYLYYLLAALGPRVRPYLWWKKYLTTLQMLQFIAIMIHSVQLAFIECKVPTQITWWVCGNACMFLVLFASFYQQAYIREMTTPRHMDLIGGFNQSSNVSRVTRLEVPRGDILTGCRRKMCGEGQFCPRMRPTPVD
ncbi:very long chain fatty acid elongase 7-like [Cherax quadricarinatus]